MSPEQIGRLRSQLRRESRWLQVQRIIVGVGYAAFGVLLYQGFMASKPEGWFLTAWYANPILTIVIMLLGTLLFFGLIVVPFLLIGQIARWSTSKSGRKNAIQKLAEPQYLGVLAEFAQTDPVVRGCAEKALANVLHDVEPDHDQFLDPYQRHCLYRLLCDPLPYRNPFKPRSHAMDRALLHTIQQIGGSEAVPYLEGYIVQNSRSRSAESKQLAVFARVALAEVRFRTAKKIIEARVAEVDQSLQTANAHVAHMDAMGTPLSGFDEHVNG